MKASNKKILVLHMGGTIGMNFLSGPKLTLAPPADDTEYRKAIEPVTQAFTNTHADVSLEYECLSTVDSNDITPEHIEELLAYIRAREHEFDAVVITHGTDTMANTLSMLSLGFLNNKDINTQPDLVTPIVVTGAQSSIHSMPQDAQKNLFNALLTAYEMCKEKYYPRVVQVFGSNILDAPYVMKIDERKDDAFGVVDQQGILGSCTSSSGISFNHAFSANVESLSAEQRKGMLTFRTAAGIKPLSSARFMICPFETVSKKIIKGSVEKTELEYLPLDQGGYVHRVNATTFGHPRSLALQAHDNSCLGIIFELTGIGNAPSSYLEAIRNSVGAYNLPIYGTLAISGGQASTSEYAAGARFRDAGVAIGYDASPAYKDATFSWLLANEPINLKAPALMTKLGVAFHELWQPTRIRKTHVPDLPDTYDNPIGSRDFSRRRAEAASLTEAYRMHKGSNLRWLKIADPELAERVGDLLPKPREEFIQAHHRVLNFASLTGWAPPNSVYTAPASLSAAVTSLEGLPPFIPSDIDGIQTEIREKRLTVSDLMAHFEKAGSLRIPQAFLTDSQKGSIRAASLKKPAGERQSFIRARTMAQLALSIDPEVSHIAALSEKELNQYLQRGDFRIRYEQFIQTGDPVWFKLASGFSGLNMF